MQTEKAKVKKGKMFWVKVVGAIVLLSIFYGIGNSSAKVDLGKEKVNYDKLVNKVDNKKKEISSIQNKLNDINKQYNEKQSEFDAAMKVVNNKKSIEEEISKLNDQLYDKKNEIKTLNSNIKEKKDQLASITGAIQEKKDAPKILPAGKFTVGKDIPAGRYKAVPNGGQGNFFVNGGADVNAMLGKGDLFEPEYVFEVVDGDEIEITMSVKFIPVK